MEKKIEPWTVTEITDEVNGNWTKTAFKRKDKQTLARDKKNVSRRDIRAFQKERVEKALRHNPKMTVGDFAKHHNTMLRRLKCAKLEDVNKS